MGRVLISAAIINDDSVRLLTPKQRWKKFVACVCHKEENECSPFVRHLKGSRVASTQWKALRKFVFERDDFTCQYCGERGVRLECDHVHPVSKGGTDHTDNLVTACFSCNRSKRDKTIAEWRMA